MKWIFLTLMVLFSQAGFTYVHVDGFNRNNDGLYVDPHRNDSNDINVDVWTNHDDVNVYTGDFNTD